MRGARPVISFGDIYGRGVVIAPDVGRRHGQRLVRLLCHPHEGGCGTVYETVSYSLRRGAARSCGCLLTERLSARAAERNATHGLTGHPLYGIWGNMIHRCENPARSSYRNYGGREQPITVCPQWHDPARFIADIEAEIGPRPPGNLPSGLPAWTLNRKDNNRGYEPGNVEWADWSTQRRNQRRGPGHA